MVAVAPTQAPAGAGARAVPGAAVPGGRPASPGARAVRPMLGQALAAKLVRTRLAALG